MQARIRPERLPWGWKGLDWMGNDLETERVAIPFFSLNPTRPIRFEGFGRCSITVHRIS